MKREWLLGAACAAVLLAFFSFSAGSHWNASRWDTPYRVGTEKNEKVPELAGGTESSEPDADAREAETAPVETAAVPDGKVNINTADKETLMTLPGVGETRAQAILDDRAANGPFRHPEDITRVPGIGEGLMEGMLEQITTESEDDP